MSGGATWVDGIHGKAMKLQMNDDNKIVFTAHPSLNVGDYTLSFWIKFTNSPASGSTQYRNVIKKDAGVTSDRAPDIWICPTFQSGLKVALHWRHNPGNVGFDCLGPGGEVTPLNGKPGFTLNQWYHVYGGKQGTTLKVYIAQAGSSYQAFTKTGIPNPMAQGDGNFIIGDAGSESAGFEIDSLELYNTFIDL